MDAFYECFLLHTWRPASENKKLGGCQYHVYLLYWCCKLHWTMLEVKDQFGIKNHQWNLGNDWFLIVWPSQTKNSNYTQPILIIDSFILLQDSIILLLESPPYGPWHELHSSLWWKLRVNRNCIQSEHLCCTITACMQTDLQVKLRFLQNSFRNWCDWTVLLTFHVFYLTFGSIICTELVNSSLPGRQRLKDQEELEDDLISNTCTDSRKHGQFSTSFCA